MEKTIYDNHSSKLVAKINGDIVELVQILDGEVVGNISLYPHEVRDISNFVSENYVEGIEY